MARIKITTNCIADTYVDKDRERIIEFSDPDNENNGGLIAFRRLGEGQLLVSLYHLDSNVQVGVEKEHLV